MRPGGGSAGGASAVTLTVEGMRCAGCAWLVERLLGKIPGVNDAAVDFPLRRAEVRFDSRTTRLHTLLDTLARAGYRAAPYTTHAEEAAIESERRARIRGLGISAVFGMQVMLLSIALHASARYDGMDPGFEQIFRWLATMLTVPVLVSVLVVTCPCALSLATPAAMTAALGGLARAGLVATRANAVERLALASHCLADKTGTLTEGRFRLHSISALAGVSESRCLAIAAALERYATHPTASAIVAAAGRLGDKDDGTAQPDGAALEANTNTREASGTGSEVEDVSAQTGGVTGRIDAVRYAVGSPEFVARACTLMPAAFGSSAGGNEALAGIPPHSSAAGANPPAANIGEGSSLAAPACEGALGGPGSAVRIGEPETTTSASGAGGNDGGTRAFLARDGALLARFILADTLRADARELIEGLRARGIETTIASGDSADAVERAADVLGVAHRLAGLSPEDKLDEAVRLAARGERVLMLGDGINDTPALAGAHVSVAMGRGAAAAASRADAVLIGDDPPGLLAGIDIARRARRIVKQNLAWAVGYNLVALPLAAAGAIPPWAAAIGMSLSSLAVAGNALRLGRKPRAAGS